MDMNFRLICTWSDGVQTSSLHSSQQLAERKISNLNYRWKKNRLPEKPQWFIEEHCGNSGWFVVNDGTYKKE